ncbi:MAG: TetR/AcrR family transcriptional regulator [Lachnospiraceae bacterium]|nr:TetR/AcrR family transcriptional regulator [Lachnospiraceae bacterium]
MSGFLSGKDEFNRARILEGTIKVFRKEGIGFTMNDLSHELGMSKKTIYTVFRDKESLLYTMVDYFFDSVKKDENEILQRADLPTQEKLRQVLGVMPVSYSDIDFGSIYSLSNKYPRVTSHLRDRLETDWETTLSLVDQGVAEGVFRPVNKIVFQLTFEAAIERFLSDDTLKKNHIHYKDALDELTNLLIGGILK